MELSNFQRKAILFIFLSILAGSILLSRKEPLKYSLEFSPDENVLREQTIQTPPLPSKININTAEVSQLMQLPGIGAGLAEEIINYRNSYGNFQTIDDLLKVPKIGEKRLEKIKDMIDLPQKEVPSTATPLLKLSEGPPSPSKMDLTNATIDQLQTLPGIGPVLAQNIIDYREKNTGFKNLEELIRVPGIGQQKFEKIKEFLYVKTAAATQTQLSQKPKNSVYPHTKIKNFGVGIYDSRIDPKIKCPYCGRQLWEQGKRKQAYIRCPHCMKLLNESQEN